MTAMEKEKQRSRVGYGSSYRKGNKDNLDKRSEIPAVIGSQVWMIKPDKEARAANPCIWMQAGVVEFKSCNNYYDCTSCKYDLGMKMKVEKGEQISWQDSMRRKPGLERICRHSLTNRIAKRACAYDYQCSSCDFDQFFEDVWSSKTGERAYYYQSIKGFRIPENHYFHNGHTWARIESGGYIRVGIDDFALKVLGQADCFDLPLMGKTLDHGKPGWGLRRNENTADILSPVDGIISEVNNNVRENPGIANRDPYSGGWLFMVRVPDIKESAQRLMTDSDSMTWMDGEVNRLEKMVEDVAGPLAADGGYLADDIYGNIPELGWDTLVHSFLKAK
jgi:glycine cleavage system H lipoate-binding protein/uncharacterized CHY-type Zn-finger protein